MVQPTAPHSSTRCTSATPDPWDFETSAYEAQKRAATLAAIAGKRFARALELGCSTGRLTVELAEVSDRIVAVDCSATALAMAEDRLEPLRVTLERMDVPASWPSGTFDLVVISEVLYFLSREEVAQVAGKCADSLTAGGTCLLVNWTGENNLPVSGDEAVAIFEEHASLTLAARSRAEKYRIDLYCRD